MSWKEKNFEEKMTPCIDNIYNKLFSNLEIISRSSRETTTDAKVLFLDKEMAIDTFLHFNDGTVITMQEKTRKNYYLRYDDFTFEYYNDPNSKEEGEWFKLAAQLYFYGFANEFENSYDKFYIINVPEFRLFLKNKIGIKTLEAKYLRYNKPPAKANFFCIPFNIIPDHCIKFKWERKKRVVAV